MNDSIDTLISDIENNLNESTLNKYISIFSNSYSDSLLPFYKKMIEIIKKIDDTDVRIDTLCLVKNNIKDIEISDYDTYFLVIDTTMLLGIEYYLIKKNDKAKYLFDEVVSFGEKYDNYSKENFYDIINCAYSWLAYYSYSDNDYEAVEKYCNKVLDNYEKVKDDPNYTVTEKESVDICKKYLMEIKKNS